MSVIPPKTSSSGFLRDFHFSTMADTALDELFGEVKPPLWMKFTIGHHLDPERFTFVFTIDVTFDPGLVMKVKGVELRNVPRKKKHFQFRFDLPQSIVQEMRDEVPKLFVKWVKKTLLENAYRMYEFDPRVGWRWTPQGALLPKCPLFDPPEEFSRTGLPFEDENGETFFPVCPFCGETHTSADPPVWIGTNMMWVHETCWRNPS